MFYRQAGRQTGGQAGRQSTDLCFLHVSKQRLSALEERERQRAEAEAAAAVAEEEEEEEAMAMPGPWRVPQGSPELSGPGSNSSSDGGLQALDYSPAGAALTASERGLGIGKDIRSCLEDPAPWHSAGEEEEEEEEAGSSGYGKLGRFCFVLFCFVLFCCCCCCFFVFLLFFLLSLSLD